MKITLALATACLAVAQLQAQRAPITVEELAKSDVGLDWKALQRGTIVWEGYGKREVNDSSLVAVMAVKVPASVDEVLKALADPKLAGGEVHRIDDTSPGAIAKSFSSYHVFDRKESKLEWFRKPKADGTFNVSEAELSELKARLVASKANELDDRGLMAVLEPMIEEMLGRRFRDYRARGLRGIAPYSNDRKRIDIGKSLADSMKPLTQLKERAPEFYDAFLRYPEVTPGEADRFEHQFYWSRVIDDGRTLLDLKHRMIETGDGYALLGERKFYVSHTIDAMHNFILVLQDGDGTIVMMVNQSFTQIVAGFGRAMKHKVGRRKVAGKIRPMFEALQRRFEK